MFFGEKTTDDQIFKTIFQDKLGLIIIIWGRVKS